MDEGKWALRMKTVVYAGTRNLYESMRVAVTSLLANNRIDRVFLLIEDDVFPYQMPDNVRTINVSNQTIFPPTGVNYKTRWTYMTMMRCALTKVLPHNKKVLWLDCDTIVDGDISDLFKTDLTGAYYAGVTEPGKSKDRLYINAGVLLINLAEIKKDGLDDRLIDVLNNRPFSFPDQDAINLLAQGKIKPLESKYNVCPFTEQTETKIIYHFAANVYYCTERMYLKYRG